MSGKNGRNRGCHTSALHCIIDRSLTSSFGRTLLSDFPYSGYSPRPSPDVHIDPLQHPSQPTPAHKTPRNNDWESHRHRFGHHLLVIRFPLISCSPARSSFHKVVSVSGKMIMLRSSPTTTARGESPPMFLFQTPSVSLVTLQRTRSR
jgi:hypothetical protein